ncbi:MAG: methyltransferase MtaB domain-containing protein [Eubacterium aggregans]|uniref:Methanol:corrinoid methyltransferase n=1 Tax=Eubacterium aggregans TaxID=81409 RepID=A0A1H4A2G7_9FIRM|nr:methyltransferase MtaB domain-containing protein [Eubacterium aggregans]MDD4691646.1 methyltransferase MtaB domain-containing protein [Eubacterium aggregans]MEA5074264.1 methyltransferase MtaB domain-containing protein [Eubacterium aggregans]SEA30166.1 methanol:corrinoid methyltransferase [Eubacterium aggregans]
MAIKFDKCAISDLEDFVYGSCPKPVTTKGGLVIGGGTVYPEINFTLPGMDVNDDTIGKANTIYTNIIDGVLKRAAELHAPGVLVEFETVPDFTENPQYGIDVNRILLNGMKEAGEKYGLKTAIRTTPNDLREMSRPPVMRGGKYWDTMLALYEQCAKDGSDFLSIESTGGKEINDDALVKADIRKAIFALGVLGSTDMEFLWGNLVKLAEENNCYAAGDSACGFANTAMVLAEKGFIPKVFAAVMRVVAVPRALVAFEQGAVGPSKDCAYEGPYLKAMTGSPIAMEGKSAAGAHLSPIGNIAACVCDTWSNESIQQVKLLSEMAPVVGMEQLVYDCRLMNTATEKGQNRMLRDLLAESDAPLDVQAWVLKPDVVLKISKELVKVQDKFLQTKLAAKLTINELRDAMKAEKVLYDRRDMKWLDKMEKAVDKIPDDKEKFYEEMKSSLDFDKFLPGEYGL